MRRALFVNVVDDNSGVPLLSALAAAAGVAAVLGARLAELLRIARRKSALIQTEAVAYGGMGEAHFVVADDVGDILPVQFDAIFRTTPERSGEIRLMAAILEDGIDCLFCRGVGRPEGRRTEQQDALCWVKGWRAPFAFDDVCLTLGIDPGRLRKALLLAYRAQQLGAVPPRLPRRQELSRTRKVGRGIDRRREEELLPAGLTPSPSV